MPPLVYNMIARKKVIRRLIDPLRLLGPNHHHPPLIYLNLR